MYIQLHFNAVALGHLDLYCYLYNVSRSVTWRFTVSGCEICSTLKTKETYECENTR